MIVSDLMAAVLLQQIKENNSWEVKEPEFEQEEKHVPRNVEKKEKTTGFFSRFFSRSGLNKKVDSCPTS